jgi:hypothetical protein
MASNMGGGKERPREPPATPLQPKLFLHCRTSTVIIDLCMFNIPLIIFATQSKPLIGSSRIKASRCAGSFFYLLQ